MQVVFIDADTHYLRKGWSHPPSAPFPLRYRVRLGPRLRVAGGARTISCRALKNTSAGRSWPRDGDYDA